MAKPGDLSRLRIMAPASPGGGWDTTARLLQRVIRSTGIARNVQVFNVEGAGGTIGLGQLSRETDDALLMMMGLVMVGAIETNKSKVKLTDVTPIARLLGEAEIIVVPKDSPYDNLEEFVAAWKEKTRGLPIAGGSAGGTDQILAGLLAQAGGRRPQADQLHRLLRRRAVAGRPARQQGGGRHLGRRRVRCAGAVRGPARAWPCPASKRSSQVPDVPTITEAGFDVVRVQLARPDGPSRDGAERRRPT